MKIKDSKLNQYNSNAIKSSSMNYASGCSSSSCSCSCSTSTCCTI